MVQGAFVLNGRPSIDKWWLLSANSMTLHFDSREWFLWLYATAFNVMQCNEYDATNVLLFDSLNTSLNQKVY